MKYLSLLFRNILRNRRRTLLTVSSIAASLFLVTTLITVLHELENPPQTPDSAQRLITRHRVSLANILPIAHREKIRRIPEVEAVVGMMWFGGVYKDPKNFFAQFATDTDEFFEIYPDILLPESEKTAFLRDRTGAIVGENLAQRFGWKLGDRIPLQGALFDFDPVLTVRGIYSGGGDNGGTFYFHWDYFNEGIKAAFPVSVDFTGFFSVRARSAAEVPAVAQKIDALFRNSTSPTKTESEKAFILGFISMMGNVRLLIAVIASAVIFTIVLVAANTMAMSIRERYREIGILKALGFSRTHVLGLLVTESVALGLSGALIGALAARLIFSSFNIAAVTAGVIQRFQVTTGAILLCAGIGVMVGLLAASIPAWLAAGRRVTDVLRT